MRLLSNNTAGSPLRKEGDLRSRQNKETIMKTNKKAKRTISLRHLALTVIPWLHCAMILAPLYAALASVVYREENPESSYYFFRALGFVVPVAVLSLSARYLKWLWQFLLVILALAAGTLWLSKCWIATVIVLILSSVKLTARVRECESVLDSPHLVGPVAFLLPAIYSGYMGDVFLQKASVLLAAIYLVMTLAYRGLERLENYLSINRSMADFPGRRIGISGGAVFGGASLLILLVAVPLILMNYSFIAFHPAERGSRVPPPIQDSKPVQTHDALMEWMMGESEQAEPSVVMAVLGDIVLVLAVVGAVGLVLYGIYALYKQFSRTVQEKNDVIESTVDLQEDLSWRQEDRKIRRLDFSPNGYIRRKYKKTISAKTKEAPQKWQSPLEIERDAGVADETLHALYEKARYSREGCTKEDKERL